MARTVTVRTIVTENGTEIANHSVSYTGSLVPMIDAEPIAGSATTQIIATTDVSAIKVFVVVTTVAATLKTNDSGTPEDSIVLVAGQPYVYHTTSYDTFQLGTDVTTFYFTVAGATAGTVTILGLVDATPS